MAIKQYPVFFKLLYTEDGTQKTYNLPDEPIGWDKVQIILKRDATYFGVNYQYTNGEIELEFSPRYGSEILKRLFDSYGTDYTIIFQYGYTKNGIEIIDFEGRLDLNTYKYNSKKMVSCTIETSGFHININTRKETKIDLFETKTLDFNPMPIAPAIDLELHSKGIKRRFVEHNYLSEHSPYDNVGQDIDFYFTYNTDNNTVSEISNYLGNSCMTWKDPPYEGTKDTRLPIWRIKENGTYEFKINTKFAIWGRLHYNGCLDPGSVDNGDCEVYFEIRNSDGSAKSPVNKTPLVNWSGRPFRYYQEDYDVLMFNPGYENGLTIDTSFIMNLEKGDEVYLYGRSSISTSGCRKDLEGSINQLFLEFSVIAITQMGNSISKAFLVHETLSRIIHSITGVQSALYSTYFGRTSLGYASNGEGAFYTILNGFLIRKFVQDGTAIRKLTTTFKEMISSLAAIFGIGIGYEYINEKLVVRVEKDNYFYQDSEIIIIPDNSDYTEEVSTDFIYNDIQVGYNKYPDEGEYMLDEFNTEQEYVTPIKTNKKDLIIKSDLIASGYAIELTRRMQYEDDHVDSSTYDDDNFIIAVRNDNGWKSEKNESFNITIDTIFSPETAYNLRITPKRNLFRWAQIINGCLTWFNNFDGIKNTAYKNNGEAETLLNTELYPIKEKSDIILTDFDGRKHYYKSIWINFKCRLSKEQIKTIKEAHNGIDPTNKNGYISTYDMNGKKVSGWLYELSYQPASEQATIKLLKADIQSSSTILSCTDFADYTSLDLENKPIPAWLEDCTFDKFN